MGWTQPRSNKPARRTRRAPVRAAPAPARSLLFASSPASAPFSPPRAAPATAGDPQATPSDPPERPPSRPQGPPPQHERRSSTPGPCAQVVLLRRGPLPGAQQGGGCKALEHHCGQGRGGRHTQQPWAQRDGQDDPGQGRGGHHVRLCARLGSVLRFWGMSPRVFLGFFALPASVSVPHPFPRPSHPARAAPTTAPPS